jgi:hypothetical protein
MAPPLPQHHLITVYEVVNETLREVYLGTTSLLAPQLALQFERRPPRAVARWRPEHRMILRCLVYAIPLREGQTFIRKYALLGRRRARRVLVEEFLKAGKEICS